MGPLLGYCDVMDNDPVLKKQCPECTKTFTRRENLVRHFKEKHDEDQGQYRCPGCPAKFGRSDTLNRHRRTYTSGGAYPPELLRKERHTSGQTDDRPTPTKRRRQAQNESGPSPVPDDQTLKNSEEPRLSVSNALSVSDPVLSVGHSEATDWNFQWPIFGEGLSSVNMDWAVDFLSQGISTHSPLDTVNSFDHTGQATVLNNASVIPDSNAEQPAINENGSYGNEPRAWSGHESRDVSPIQQSAHFSSSKSAAYVDNEEQNDFFIANTGKVQTSGRVTEKTRVLMFETVMSSVLDGFCSQENKPKQSFASTLSIEYFLQLYFVHVHPRFPVVHLPTFDPNNSPPILSLAMVILGSSYSESNRGRFALMYLEGVRMTIKLMQQRDSRYVRHNPPYRS